MDTGTCCRLTEDAIIDRRESHLQLLNAYREKAVRREALVVYVQLASFSDESRAENAS
jgi:hypothetical protein